MVKKLLDRKLFRRYRYDDKYYLVAIDATGVVSFDHKHCDQCLHKTSKKGKTTYFHQVAEARLVTANGFSISLATEWIDNSLQDDEYDKQDCERKAFQRLSDKLKAAFPRLHLIILADGLYPYKGFFDTCKRYHWAFCITFKDGNLPSVWTKIRQQMPLSKTDALVRTTHMEGKTTIIREHVWVNNLSYQGHTIHWIACHEHKITPVKLSDGESNATTKRTSFVHITNLPISHQTAAALSQTGRLRWKIENEGFNALKTGGYAMTH